MTDCGCRSAGNGLHLDALKRVNYSLGLVLGEEEFRQDQLHLRARDQLANRALHGYGTISGLEVTVAGTEVMVGPGLALDPAGRFVCVASAQCADVAGWLRRHEDEVVALFESPPELPATLSLYVELCYLECETDKVPLPLEPCRTGDDSMVASRVSESFELRFSLTQPVAVGEVTGGALEDAVEDLVAGAQPGDVSSPDPVSAGTTESAVYDWAVLGRPAADGTACIDAPSACVPLARIVVPVDAGPDGAISPAGDVVVDDEARPVVLSTRFLQEWLTQLTASEKVEPYVLALDDLSDVDTAGTDEGDLLTFSGGQWVPAPAPPDAGGGVTAHEDLTGLDADDHPQYFLADGTRKLTGSLDGGMFQLRQIGDATDAQDAVTLAQIDGVMRNGDTASGDLSGSYPSPLVARLQNRPVADADPKLGDALLWNGAFWTPGAVEAGETRPQVLLPLATITRLDFFETDGFPYEIWFNVDAPRNDVEVTNLGDGAIHVREEIAGRSFLQAIRHDVVDQPTRNVFVVALAKEPKNGLLRFDFLLEELVVTDGRSLMEAAADRSIAFEGQNRGVVTKFVRVPNARPE